MRFNTQPIQISSCEDAKRESPDFLASGSGSVERPRFQVVNRTRNTVLATSLAIAGTNGSRRKGLLGRSGLSRGEGLWIIPCECIHTFFMQFPIDVIFLDRERHIRKLRSDVQPWRISGCLRAYSILELPPGTIRSTY